MAALWPLVPMHELLHAAGCLATGGTVSRLELAPMFGGGLLAAWLPWVEAGGRYAGRLAGFAPAGDLSYLATVLAPYLVLVPLGGVLARWAVRRRSALLLGVGLAFLGQPLAALGGDCYEAAAIPLTALARAAGAAWAPSLRGDDVAVVAAAAAAVGRPAAWLLLGAGLAGGTVIAVLLLAASGGIAGRGQVSTVSPTRPAREIAEPSETSMPLEPQIRSGRRAADPSLERVDDVRKPAAKDSKLRA